MDGDVVFEIVTNNPRLTADFAVSHGVASVHRVEGSPLDVLDRTEALLQEGRTLVSAPLPPNVPLMRAPYRSLLLAQSARRYDAAGLLSIGKARERLTTQRAIDEDAGPGRSEDFALIDEDLLCRALRDSRLCLDLKEGGSEAAPLP